MRILQTVIIVVVSQVTREMANHVQVGAVIAM